VALEIAGPVGGVVHVRDQEHGPGETVAHGVQDPVQVPQDALDSRISRGLGGPEQREKIVPAGGQGHDHIPAALDRPQRADLRREHVVRRRSVRGQEVTGDPGEPRGEVPPREPGPDRVVVPSQEGRRPQAGGGQPPKRWWPQVQAYVLAVGVVEVGVAVDGHAVSESHVGGTRHAAIISGERRGKIGECLASTV